VTVNPYARYLGSRDALGVISSSAAALHQVLGRIDAAQVTQPRAPGKWSARDILCHLADCEIVFAFRLRQALAQEHHVIQPFDQDRFAAPYRRLDAATALATFSAVRQWNVEWLATVPPEAASRRLTHPERGDMNFYVIVETMAGHDLNHLQQLEAISVQHPASRGHD
jgi:hypothetical protein